MHTDILDAMTVGSERNTDHVATNRDTMSDFDDGFYSEMLPNRQRKGSPPGY